MGVKIAIKFQPKIEGPSINIDDTIFTLKKISKNEYGKSFIRLGLEKDESGEIDFNKCNPEQQIKLIENRQRFILNNICSIKNLVDDDGKEIDFFKLSDELKLLFIDNMFENEEFSNFANSYIEGIEKKI